MLLERVLERLVAAPEREREWIDMLSQLEYVGARKIMKALSYEEISLEVLQHVADEAQHAYQLKALVSGNEPDHCSWASNPLSEIGWRYFQTLDQEISRIPQVTGLSYPAVSWAVEQRVLQVYPIYLEKTARPEVQRVLTRILAQERRHGGRFDTVAFPEGVKQRLLAIEAPLWKAFLEDLERHLETGTDETAPVGFSYARPQPDVRATD